MWTRRCEAYLRRSMRDEPMPGIWPRYTARTELAMQLYDELTDGSVGIPRAFRKRPDAEAIAQVDCYAIIEALLTDERVAAVESKVAKKV